MDNEAQLGSHELDMFIELIITIIMMTVCVVYTSQMITKMDNFARMAYNNDKVNMTNIQHQAYDPFYMNGYTALMYAWVYDNQSTVPITWLGSVTSPTNNRYCEYAEPVKADVDYTGLMQVSDSIDDIGPNTADKNYAMLSSVHKDGSPISNFDTWKTQVIAGSTSPSSIGYYNSVIKTMMSSARIAAGNAAGNEANNYRYYFDTNTALYGVYRGRVQRNLRLDHTDPSSNVLVNFKYRMVYTNKYNSYVDHSQYTERKVKQWVIIPVYVKAQ